LGEPEDLHGVVGEINGHYDDDDDYAMYATYEEYVKDIIHSEKLWGVVEDDYAIISVEIKEQEE
jgi:hypothetical protein